MNYQSRAVRSLSRCHHHHHHGQLIISACLIVIAGSIGASVHPLVMVTQPGTMVERSSGSGAGAASCSASASTAAMGNSVSGTGATWERASNQSSSPSHSQMSRNSSRKSNNSILVSNGKLEGTSRTVVIVIANIMLIINLNSLIQF